MSGSGTVPLQVLHLQGPGESEDGYLEPGIATQRRNRKRGQDLHEHDSGVVDVDSIQADLTPPDRDPGHMNHTRQSPQSVGGRMPMKDRPDSLAVKGHEYEDLPTSRYNMYHPPKFYYTEVNGQERPLPPPLAKLPSMNASTEKLCDGSGSGIVSPNQTVNNNNVYRRRQNPLYDSRSSETDSIIKSSGKQNSCLFCPYSGLMVIGFCLCVLLVLIVLMLTGAVHTKAQSPFAAALVDSNVTTLEAALYKINELERKYSDVVKQYERLEAQLLLKAPSNQTMADQIESNTRAIAQLEGATGSQAAKLSKMSDKMTVVEGSIWRQNGSLMGVSLHVSDLQTQLRAVEAKASQNENQVGTVQSSLQGQINRVERKVDSISLVPGPRGFNGSNGAGDLSQCRYRRIEKGEASQLRVTETRWEPTSLQGANTWVVMGMECSTDGGTQADIKRQFIPGQQLLYQFKCVCSGNIQGRGTRFCQMHVWDCPRRS